MAAKKTTDKVKKLEVGGAQITNWDALEALEARVTRLYNYIEKQHPGSWADFTKDEK